MRLQVVPTFDMPIWHRKIDKGETGMAKAEETALAERNGDLSVSNVEIMRIIKLYGN